MVTSRRAIVLALAVSSIACEDPFANGLPSASPGVVVPGISGIADLCSFVSGCTAWSADGKTLYVIARAGTGGTASLMAVDLATVTSHVVATIDKEALGLHVTADGTAIYFTGPSHQPSGGGVIERMSLADGSTTVVAQLNDLDFVVAPSGTALAYRAPKIPVPVDTSAPITSVPVPDTIVVLDLPSGARRGTMVGEFTNNWAFSPDGKSLGIGPAAYALYVWHLDSGGRDTISTVRAKSALFGVAWSHGAFRMLFHAFGAEVFTDTSLAGGTALTLSGNGATNALRWLPDSSAMWMLRSTQICGSLDCSARHYDFVYTTASASVTVGSANSGSFLMVDPSPDGRWIAHAETPDVLYLIRRTTP